eukprot:1180406-Prorocentrum_minimum.AAC.1
MTATLTSHCSTVTGAQGQCACHYRNPKTRTINKWYNLTHQPSLSVIGPTLLNSLALLGRCELMPASNCESALCCRNGGRALARKASTSSTAMLTLRRCISFSAVINDHIQPCD